MQQIKVALLPGSPGKYGLIGVREGGATEVTNQANMAEAGTIYACGGIIVLRGRNYVTHTFILSTTHRTRLIITSEEEEDPVCAA